MSTSHTKAGLPVPRRVFLRSVTGLLVLGHRGTDAAGAGSVPAATCETSPAFPSGAWEEAVPESQGLDSAKLNEAAAFLQANAGEDGVRELVMVRGGRMVWRGDHIDHIHGVWSCTKTFTSTILGLLVADGKCSLETRAADILPEMEEHYGGVTLRHFATMTSGYRAEGDETTDTYTHGPSSTPFAPNPKPLFAPGSAYAYWDSAMNQFAHVLTRIAGEPLDTLFKRRVADSIGMNPAAWSWGSFDDVGGLRVNGGSGNKNNHVRISARELARLGHLFLHGGRWGERQVVPADWVRAATSLQVAETVRNAWPQSGFGGPGHYGYNWWVNGARASGELLWPDVPRSAFAAQGYNNNKLLVIPAWDMVIVRLGLDGGSGRISHQTLNRFLAKVAAAGAADL